MRSRSRGEGGWLFTPASRQSGRTPPWRNERRACRTVRLIRQTAGASDLFDGVPRLQRWPWRRRPDLAALRGDANLEAVGEPTGALDEVRGRGRRTEFVRGLGKQFQPTIEMRGIDRQRQMLGQRLTVVAPAHQRHRRPEIVHAAEVRLPIVDLALENRSNQRIAPGAGVKAADQTIDHGFVNPGPGDDIGNDKVAASGAVLGMRTHRLPALWAPIAACSSGSKDG